jgi:biopolymer transport protein ExbB
MSRWTKMWNLFVVALLTLPAMVMAQAPEAAPAAVAGAGEAPAKMAHSLFYEMVFGSGWLDTLAWFAMFGTSMVVVALIIDGIVSLKRVKLMPPDLIDGVRSALANGDLSAATQICEHNPSPLSRILLTGFSNIQEGYEVIQESVAKSAEYESEKMLQRVNYLNICGQLGPMEGLVGTVLGMIHAFSSLGGMQGAAKTTALAKAIGTAMHATVFGLLIAIPSLLAYVILKNYATRLILEMQHIVLDLIKVLRSAEVEEQA